MVLAVGGVEEVREVEGQEKEKTIPNKRGRSLRMSVLFPAKKQGMWNKQGKKGTCMGTRGCLCNNLADTIVIIVTASHNNQSIARFDIHDHYHVGTFREIENALLGDC